ncbi:MAG: AmiR/NasT family two-component response regulator [Candidatus Azotimanducaceae bacterium]
MKNNREYLKEFKKLDFLLVVPQDEDGNHIGSELRRLGSNVKHLWPVPMPLPSEGAVLICEFSAEIADCTPWLPGESPLPFILHIPRNSPADFKQIRNCAPHGLLYSPGTEISIANTILLSRDQFHYEQRLRSRIFRLDENLRSMRSVEQAKSILMDAKHINEEEAYRVLRRTAMERRITLGSIAAAIVDSHELLK